MSKKIIPKKADPVTPRVPFVQMCENVFFLKCPTVLEDGGAGRLDGGAVFSAFPCYITLFGNQSIH